ncbi:hypothetical protein C1645_881615 [Glomus cerebriforme]|uniref:Crinkler effector protein N-terminal domain-containing protein n=1 Tax=Glomus cerebriforme TaxID=658196 RepID=A0A397S9P1_9GLOM|nr:hypothetical protein C1645_881615 [Glomus cerebriforme]
MGIPCEEKSEMGITLRYVIKNRGSNGIFTITIDKNESTYDLKKRIKEEFPTVYRNFDAIDIRIWKVLVPFHGMEKLNELKRDNSTTAIEHRVNGEVLYGMETIEEVFGTPIPKHFHIIVQEFDPPVDEQRNENVEKNINSSAGENNTFEEDKNELKKIIENSHADEIGIPNLSLCSSSGERCISFHAAQALKGWRTEDIHPSKRLNQKVNGSDTIQGQYFSKIVFMVFDGSYTEQIRRLTIDNLFTMENYYFKRLLYLPH